MKVDGVKVKAKSVLFSAVALLLTPVRLMRSILRGEGGTRGTAFVPAGLFLILLGFLSIAQALAAGLDAQVDRARLAEGESLLLTLSGPGDVWGTPDTAALARDFAVQNQGQGTSTVMTNGRVTTTREWRFLLTPKASGRFTIPAMRLGELESLPIAVEVLPAAQAAQVGEPPPARLEAELDRDQVYVQGQVIYTLRVLLRPQVQNASLEDPLAEGVQIELLGEDRVTETQRDGLRYRVVERRYALLPQHSGAIEIPAPVLSAAVPESRTGRGQAAGTAPGSPFGSGGSAFEQFFGRDPFAKMDSLFQRTRPIQVRGPALTLEVRPRPAGAPVPWLPAEELRLAESWTPDPAAAQTRLRVGEPITRTIALTAQGLSATQLPDLTGAVPPGVKSYPDKPRTETRAEGDTLVAVKEIKQALVPTVAGKLVLPEIRLAWWDTRADQERVAVLPARTLEVLPATGAVDDQTPRGQAAAEPVPLPHDQGQVAHGADPASGAGLTQRPPLAEAASYPSSGGAQGSLSALGAGTTAAGAGAGAGADSHEMADHTTDNKKISPDFNANFHEGPATSQTMKGSTGVFHANPVPEASSAPGTAAAPASATAHGASTPLTAVASGWPLPAGHWPWLAAAMAFLWLTTLLLWWRERRRQSPVSLARTGGSEISRASLAAARERVRQACQAQEPRATREALLAWGQVRWPEDPPRRLETLAARLGGPAASWMGRLDQCLYAPGGAAGWDGPAAWRDLGPALTVAAERSPGRTGGEDPLPPLYAASASG